MRVIKTELYKFKELSEESKQKAIELHRNNLYEYNDFSGWAIDDCFLLEPLHNELEKLGFKGELLIKNNRKIYFSLGRDRYIDISKAMEIQDNDLFLKWLGVTDRMIKEGNVCFTIGKDTIGFGENDYTKDFTDRDLRILERAEDKFENHCNSILNSIEESIDWNYTDEAITESIECNDYEFTKDGKQY